MSQVLQLLLWVSIVVQLLLGIRLIGETAGMWEQAFKADYQMAVCGRYRALAANLRAAVTTWRKMGCAGEDEFPVEREVDEVLGHWRERYGELHPDSCAEAGPLRVSLHRERNRDLDADYPNWVLRYE